MKQTASNQSVVRIRPGRPSVEPAAFVQQYHERSLRVLAQIPIAEVGALIDILRGALEEARHVFICGNGGSAATASHLAAGLGKDGSKGRPKRFRALSLTDNVPWITSLANDADYSAVFVEQLENFAEADDVLIAFSGSGNSPNIVRAVEWANANDLLTVGVTGRPGGRLARLAQHPIVVDSSHMGHVEEAHFLIQHLISYYFEETE